MAINQALLASQITAAFTSVQAAVATVPSLRDATLVQLYPIAVTVAAAEATVDAAVAALDADISTTTVGGIVVGQPAPQLAATLREQLSASQQLVRALYISAYLGRIQTNLAQATG